MKTTHTIESLILDKQTHKSNISDSVVRYTEEYKQNVIDFHYTSGLSCHALSVKLDLTPSSIFVWKKKYGKEKTAIIHGSSLRNDVRTKCLAVKSFVEDNISANKLSRQYNVVNATIYMWIREYKDTYNEYIDTMPDGVPFVAKQTKMVYGNKNIDEVQMQLIKKSDAIKLLMEDSINLNKSDREMLGRLSRKTESDKKKIEQFAETKAEFGL